MARPVASRGGHDEGEPRGAASLAHSAHTLSVHLHAGCVGPPAIQSAGGDAQRIQIVTLGVRFAVAFLVVLLGGSLLLLIVQMAQAIFR